MDREPRSFRIEAERDVPLVLAASTYNVPLYSAEDYSRIDAYQIDVSHPTVLDHAQYFLFLSDMAERMWGVLGAEARLFFELRAPYIDALPPNLLDPRILMGTGLRDEAEFWSTSGTTPVCWIADQIRRDLDYPGDNTIRFLAWPEALSGRVSEMISGSWERHAVQLTEI